MIRFILPIIFIAQAANALEIITSNAILANLARELVQDKANVTSVVSAGSDPHVIELKPTDFIAMDKADIIFINGEGLESWELRIPKKNQGKVVVATQGLPLQLISSTNLVSPTNAHVAGIRDPHFWQDPRLASRALKNLTDRLIELKPEYKKFLAQRQATIEKKYAELFENCKTSLKKLSSRKAVVTHSSFGYFSKAFDIEFLSVNGWSTQNEPKPRDVAHIKEQLQKQKVGAIFFENGIPSPLLKKLSKATQIKVGGALYGDILTNEDGDAPTYEKMIVHNCSTIAFGLK